jgi:hypothetical protein
VLRHADELGFASMVKQFHHAGDLLHHAVDVFARWSFLTCVVVRKSAPTELRQFILTQHQAGVPSARIIQGMSNSMLAFETWLMATVQFK